ncbi:MAG TPA: adenylosuccinate lyase [Steroidobacteraceae bacterium]|nr:adenylosuccinate lyase [Steroidobacteraceae bacterium]
MDLTPLTALSPVDGRYAPKLQDLRAGFSEAGLIAHRIRVQAAWLLHLSRAVGLPALSGLSKPVLQLLQQLAATPPADAAASVKAIELRINHDVKAVEYYVRERLTEAGADARVLEFVHFACTSEDINNLSYAAMLRDARANLILPGLDAIIESLRQIAHRNAATAMLARTHGQPASPTTLGKEIANFAARLQRQQAALARIEILGKFNGATGNYNAHRVALADIDWPAVSRDFVESLGLRWNPYTTQIEPHDWIAELCDALARANTILIGLCRDVWGYVSLGYFRQRVIEGEVGSSTMPHKVNPIDFENAEGNFGVANALLRHFSEKLPISRWQRDLTDSTVMRNLGVALGHTLIALQSLAKGLSKLEADAPRTREDLDDAWEVLAEALQTVMRARGIEGAYEQLKTLSRGHAVTRESLHAFIEKLPLPVEEQRRLKALTPAGYTGYAQELAQKI